MSVKRSQAWIDAMSRIADEAPPLGPEQLERLNAILGGRPAPRSQREVTRRRRWSAELDGLCGIDRSRGDEVYASADNGMTLGVAEREAVGRRLSA